MEVGSLLALLAAFILGISKAGLKGMGLVVVALLAHAYGSKASTGILVPLLLVGDVFSVIYYNRYVKWKYLIRFLPAMIVGVLIAVVTGRNLDENSFKYWMAIVILISVAILFWYDLKKDQTFPKNPIFAGIMGIAAGFATMIGNLAGAFANIFFLATQMPKNQIIGTAAWLFLIINLFKVPFHIWSWQTINTESLLIDLYLFPAVIIGFFVGLKIVNYISESWYRKILLVATAIGAIFIVF